MTLEYEPLTESLAHVAYINKKDIWKMETLKGESFLNFTFR